MKSILNFVKYVFAITLSVVSLLLAIFIVYQSAIWLLPNKYSEAIEIAFEEEDYDHVAYSAEISREHAAVVAWSLSCHGVNDVSDLPASLVEVVAVPGMQIENGAPGNGMTAFLLEGHERGLLELSKTVHYSRIAADRKLGQAYQMLEFSQIVAIIIGLATTILVSLSSIDFLGSDTSAGRAIRVAAIVLPAVGTAAAALDAFYGPRDEMGRSSVSLESYTQLHAQISSDLWSIGCKDEDKLADKLGEWTSRFQDIRSLGNAPGGNKGEKDAKSSPA
ncbi:hypothetical protein [Azospirillum sp. SYSU D00513]|uniref:hypothetical protein n=1 Tax=Azospirillum sp. SYSU D00513 TaxID=2812561 RepID=UPI001A961704|nr:hypothetical protein [Azospirillum sp. SYSU D00513]